MSGRHSAGQQHPPWSLPKTRLLLAGGAAVFACNLFAADPAVIPASELARKWKRTKSLVAPVEKVRKGLTVETPAGGASQPLEFRVDADSGCSFQNIQFQVGSANIAGGSTLAQLTEIAKAMLAAGTESFVIEGHTCDLGDTEQNLRLSQRRSMAVREILVGLGVPPGRLVILSFGESDPVVANADEMARAQNRRVQIFRKL